MLFLVLLLGGQQAHAIEAADIATLGPEADLTTYFARLETDRRDIQIETPGSVAGQKEFMSLSAKGEGPLFRWLAATFTNSGAARRDVVLTIPEQGFVGSRLLWPVSLDSRIVSLASNGAIDLERMPEAGTRTYSFSLDPGTKATIAFETLGASPPAITLWQRGAYDQQKNYFAFFRGALLGIASLLAAALFILYAFRPKPVFLAAGGFALASLAFMLLEAGHMPSLLAVFGFTDVNLSIVRAFVEGAMASLLIFFLVMLLDLQRLKPVLGNSLLVAAGLSLAIPLYGLAEPEAAAGLARILFGLVALGGFSLVFYLWRRGDTKAETTLFPSGAILLWGFLALVALFATPNSTGISPVLLSALCAVLVVMGFTLAHHAFSEGYLSRHFFREAGRRALAIAGARAHVWDWQPEEGDLFVGEDLERALGIEHGFFSESGAEGFMELMHPADRTAYHAAVEGAVQQGNGIIEREFRLQHRDGGFRWFQLRGRAMPGQGRRAIRCIGTLTDVTNAKRSEERLLSDAVYDLVTGLPNRALFIDRTSRALAGDPALTPVYVLLIDIDRFKIVNDALGHEAGDSLLSVLGRRLSTELGPADSIARLPGDQFAILFVDETGDRDIAAFCEGIRTAVARPINLDTGEIFLSCCIGVAHYRQDGLTADQLLKDAAIALYEAKRRGGGFIEVFDSAMRDERAELVILESELRRAIERNEIEVHYQPIASLADMNLAGFEALVRWNHPVLGLLAPESFLSLAEQTGMIKDIGRAVLNEAAHQLGIWQRSFPLPQPIFVAVNVSSVQVMETDLIDDVKQVLHREGVIRQTLKLEVTESLVMQYPERATQILERLRELGIGLACDDFGTGYSSLASLRKLPFDTLKVDRSFLAADGHDHRSSVILEAIIAMAHALGLSIVAEGIENQSQVDRLGLLNCDLGQGYFIGRPMTAKQVSEALAGLPYASSMGRTAITWLWERATKDPAPAPRTTDLTAADFILVRETRKQREMPKAVAPAKTKNIAEPAEMGEAAEVMLVETDVIIEVETFVPEVPTETSSAAVPEDMTVIDEVVIEDAAAAGEPEEASASQKPADEPPPVPQQASPTETPRRSARRSRQKKKKRRFPLEG